MKKPGRKPSPKPVTMAEITIIKVEDPHYQREHHGAKGNTKDIDVQFNMRESYVGWLFARKLIDAGEKQAGDEIRQAYERMGGRGAGAIDYTKEHVDGGQIAQTITDGHLLAAARLREANAWLGPEGFDLTMKLAGECLWPKDLSPDRARQEYLGLRFRECLDTLAVNRGHKMRRLRRA